MMNQTSIANVPDPLHLVTGTPHGLSIGFGLSQGTEIRFVADVIDPLTVQLNAPFSSILSSGQLLTPCLTYQLGNTLPSVSIFDFWDPTTALNRIVTGATVDSMSITLNAGFHEMSFTGLAADLLDSGTFSAGTDGLQSYPTEPEVGPFDYSVVPGNLGEAWVGASAQQLLTLTQANVQLKNNLVPRNMEFGTAYPSSIAAGFRDVFVNFALFADDSSTVQSLYFAAKERTPTSLMLQLGRQQGQMMGIYLPAVVLEIPFYDDKEPRLIWEFKANMAQGTKNDELFLTLA